jgi:hypothetical protein
MSYKERKMQIDLCDGKYTYILNEDTGVQEVLRYGEPWSKEDLLGDNLVLAMAQRIVELEDELENFYSFSAGWQ